MAEPKEFLRSNSTWHGQGDVGELPTYMDGEVNNDRVIISCWSLTAEEIADILDTGEIWLTVHTNVHPAVSLGSNPFPKEGE